MQNEKRVVMKLFAAALVVSLCAPQAATAAFAADPVSVNSEVSGALDPAELKDGEYSVEISLQNASNPANASMANNAVNPAASLFVRDGSYYLQVEFRGMTIGSMMGYLKSLSYLDGETYREAEVLSEYEDGIDRKSVV